VATSDAPVAPAAPLLVPHGPSWSQHVAFAAARNAAESQQTGFLRTGASNSAVNPAVTDRLRAFDTLALAGLRRPPSNPPSPPVTPAEFVIQAILLLDRVPNQLGIGVLIVLFAIVMMSLSTIDVSEQLAIGVVVVYLSLLANGLRGEAGMCWCIGSLLATALGLIEVFFESDEEAVESAARFDAPTALACQGVAFFLAGVGIASQPLRVRVLVATFAGDLLLMLTSAARYERTSHPGYLLVVPLASSGSLAAGGLAVCWYRRCRAPGGDGDVECELGPVAPCDEK
jgi:hypothetical protein